MLDSSKKVKGLAVAIAMVLHGLAGVGLVHMSMKPITPTKFIPPLEIEFIKPEPPKPEKVILNNLESPEPPKPHIEPTKAVMPAPSEGAKASEQEAKPEVIEQTAKPEPTPAPVNEPIAEPTPINEPEEAKLVEEPPAQDPEPIINHEEILEQQRQQALWEHQQKILKEREEQERKEQERIARENAERLQQETLARQQQEQLEKERQEQERLAKEKARQEQEEKERLAKEQAENARKEKERLDAENARKAAEAQKAEAARKAAEAAAQQQAQGRGKGDSGKGKGDAGDKGKDNGSENGSSSGKSVDLGTLSAASWKRAPNFSGLTSDSVEAIKLNVHLTFDAQGKITDVKGVHIRSDKDLEREIRRRIRQAQLHPNVLNGNSKGGRGAYIIDIQLR